MNSPHITHSYMPLKKLIRLFYSQNRFCSFIVPFKHPYDGMKQNRVGVYLLATRWKFWIKP